MAGVTKREIQDNYTTPGHPTAFSALSKVYDFYDGRASATLVKQSLEELDAYTRHREYKQPHTYNPYYIYRQRQQVQADLIDVRHLREHNDGVTYLLLLIDLFSRKIWVYPMQVKTAAETKRLLSDWLLSLGPRRQPEMFTTDAGKEFKNNAVASLLRDKNIEQKFASGTSKAAYAERANKTFQILFNKYMTHNQTLRYVDKIPALVRSYNERGHRSLDGVSPNEADKPRSQMWIRGILTREHAKRAAAHRTSAKLKVGDNVRVKIMAKKITSDSRAYNPQFHGEYFTVTKVKTNMMIPMYEIKSLDTDEVISDSFYQNELQRVRGDTFKVEKVLRRRGRGPNRELFVKWLFFGDRHNSWVKASDVTNVY